MLIDWKKKSTIKLAAVAAALAAACAAAAALVIAQSLAKD